jgi:CRP-like cAMP-binding protein
MDLSTYFSVDFLLSFVTLANVLGVIGGLCTVASMSMKTVIPLRIAGIASALFFLLSGVFSRSIPAIFLYGMLLPLNSYRLFQMMELIKKVRAAASSDLSMDWLQPFMTRRAYKKGEVVFRKGEVADEMFLAAKGKYKVSELNIELRPGHIFGEMGLLTSGFQRTASVECIESGHLLTISYDKVRELYFENPEFGFYFLRLVGERLLQNLKRVEDMLADERQKHAATAGHANAKNEQREHALFRPAYENLYLFARLRKRWRSAADARVSWMGRLRGRMTMPRLRWKFR